MLEKSSRLMFILKVIVLMSGKRGLGGVKSVRNTLIKLDIILQLEANNISVAQQFNNRYKS